MSGFVNHLKGQNPEEIYLASAIGIHLVQGTTAKSISDGASYVTVQNLLGEAYGKGWKGIRDGIWFKGIRVAEGSYKFYPGIMSPGNADSVQGVDSIFTDDTPHSNTTWIRFDVPEEIESTYYDNKANPPTDGLRLILETQKADIYDASGNVAAASQYITNAADAAIFYSKAVRKYPNSRLNFASLAALRSYNNITSVIDYTTLGDGVGLTGYYYEGNNFNTLLLTRIDPSPEFDLSDGAPAFQQPIDNFSVKWKGKIKAKYSETYTFYLTHNDGGRLYVNGTNLVDQFVPTPTLTHSGTIALTADNFYPIEIHWNELAGEGSILLEWESTSQPREIVPQEVLYPENQTVKNYECHVKFIQPTSFDTALTTVLQTSNAFYQEADGKLNFYSFDTLEPTFDFDLTNIVENTINIYPRYSQLEAANLPTRYQADGLDIDSQYLEKFNPPVYFDVSNDDFSGHIRTKTVDVGNTKRIQAGKNLKLVAALLRQGFIVEFEGLPITYPVLANDLVTLTIDSMNWDHKEFIVLESTDKSIDQGADNRIFKIMEWMPYT